MTVQSRRKSQKSSQVYLSVLEPFWDGRPQTALEKLSKIIADEPDNADRFRLYRLWIEILAQLGELGTLKSLVDHLHLLSVMEPEDSHTFLSLRGLIYLEVDDFAAASLCYKAIRSYIGSDYCDEFKYRIQQRVAPNQVHSDLAERVGRLEDYFHLQTVGLLASDGGQTQLFEQVGARAQKLFSESPLLHEIKMHHSFNVGNFQRAQVFAEDLAKKFPGNFDYSVFAAFAAFKLDKVETTINVLERAMVLGGDEDVDIIALLEQAYDRMFAKTKESHWKRKAIDFAEKLATLKEELDMLQVAEMADADVVSNDVRLPSVWMLKLDAPDFFNLRELPEDEVSAVVRGLDESAMPGDIVFLAGNDYRPHKKSAPMWRLGAVYQVASEPEWNPIGGHEVVMRLLSRPSVSIPFDVRFHEGKIPDTGVINLDIESIDLITETIKEFGSDDAGAKRILKEMEKMRASG